MLNLMVTDGDEIWTTTLDEFLDANEGDDDTCDAVRALAPDQVLPLGGGATPDMWVTLLDQGSEQRLMNAMRRV